MNIRLGFIGAGNMGAALIKGILKTGMLKGSDIYVYDVDMQKIESLKNETGIEALGSGREVVEKSDVVIVAVKPNVVKNVLECCREAFDSSKILVSVAAGMSIKTFKDILGSDKKVIRAMPNTPALVGEGMTLISHDNNIDSTELETVKALFECTGRVEVLEEKLMSEVIALTASSPAYVFMFIEAMSDAAVLSGIPRNLSYRLAAQSILGSAKMVLETGKHPAELKDQVCSPGGTTIEAVAALEKNGFRHAVMEAMNECTKKARDIGLAAGKDK